MGTLKGTYLQTGNPNMGGGVNRGRPRLEAFSFCSALSSSHTRARHPRASFVVSLCSTHACGCTSCPCCSGSSASAVTPLLHRK